MPVFLYHNALLKLVSDTGSQIAHRNQYNWFKITLVLQAVVYVQAQHVQVQQRRWCSGNINAFQAFALGSIPGRRRCIF